jgi:selenocysteine-specific translation elongation factor
VNFILSDSTNIIASIFLDPELASMIGKKGSENSITFYNRKTGEDVIVLLAPTSLTDKFFAVTECMLLSKKIVISTKDVDSVFGEILIGASLLENRRIILTDENNVDKLISGLGAEIEYSSRDRVIEIIQEHDAPPGSDLRIDIDKAFPVKGVGTVVLGIVTSGTVKVHDNVLHTSGKTGSIRSIQSQDEDVKEAGTGTRVGLAMKGIEYEDIDKGTLFTSKPMAAVKEISATIRMNRISPEQILPGTSYFLASNFNYVACKITKLENGSASIVLDKATALAKGDEFLLVRSKAPRIFAGGKVN